MNNKEKLILAKLVSLAEKQQKILTKLAQAAQDDSQANISYLKNTWQTAAINSGVSLSKSPTVTYTPGSNIDGITTEGNYTVTGEIPANKRDMVLKQFKAQIASQKPELDSKVSTIFNDPTV